MASRNSWESIRKYGLLSTSKLLDLFEVPPLEREKVENTKRWESIYIVHPRYGTAVIRDQKPLSESKLKNCLTDCDLQTWYRQLNSKVFFWLDLERLKTLMSAKEYRGKIHTVLTIDTEPLVRKWVRNIRLSPLNSGSTSPFAHARGLESFMKLEDYPFAERLKRGDYGCVAELTVENGVSDIAKHTVRVAHAKCQEGNLRTVELLYQA